MFHHLAGLDESLDEVIDVRDLHSSALGDPCSAGTVEDADVIAFCRGHRENDRLDPVHLFLVDGVDGVLELPGTGQHPEDLAQRPQFPQLLHLSQEILQAEAPLTCAEFFGCLSRGFRIKIFLGLLDQGQNITHPEDSGGHPIRVEDVEVC